eukprot:1139763-Pelagomonas_calceolata.AAC.3
MVVMVWLFPGCSGNYHCSGCGGKCVAVPWLQRRRAVQSGAGIVAKWFTEVWCEMVQIRHMLMEACATEWAWCKPKNIFGAT